MRNCNLFGTKSDVSWNTARQAPWRTRVSPFGATRKMRRARTHPWTCTALPSPAVYSASSHFGPFPTPFASHLPVQRANRASTFALHLSRISPFPTPIRPPFHPTPSRPFLPPFRPLPPLHIPYPSCFRPSCRFFVAKTSKSTVRGRRNMQKRPQGSPKQAAPDKTPGRRGCPRAETGAGPSRPAPNR